MFHIHMVRKDWGDVSTAIAIKEITNQLGTEDVSEISKYTGLKSYKIRKYLKILDYPKPIIDKFLRSEAGEDKLDTDILVELSRPIHLIQERFPEIYKEFNTEKIVDIIIEKKYKEKIANNREIRFLSKLLESGKRANINRSTIKNSLLNFLTNENVTAKEVYETVSMSYFLINLGKKLESIKKDLDTNLDIKRMHKEEISGLVDNLTRFKEYIEENIRKIKKLRS